MKYLVVIDMQNDFIDGVLGSEQAKRIVPNVVEKVKHFDGQVIFTRDTHNERYLRTLEGKKLPVPHCIKGTEGHSICNELLPYAQNVIDKNSFGSLELPEALKRNRSRVEEIQICGLCTDICVIANAIILKTAFPETEIIVDSSCTAGVSEESHNIALNAMRGVQITVI